MFKVVTKVKEVLRGVQGNGTRVRATLESVMYSDLKDIVPPQTR